MMVTKVETEGHEALFIEEEGKEPFMFFEAMCPSAYRALEFLVELERNGRKAD